MKILKYTVDTSGGLVRYYTWILKTSNPVYQPGEGVWLSPEDYKLAVF